MFAQNFINKKDTIFIYFFLCIIDFLFGIYKLGHSTTLTIDIDKWNLSQDPTPHTPNPIPNNKKEKKSSSHKIGNSSYKRLTRVPSIHPTASTNRLVMFIR